MEAVDQRRSRADRARIGRAVEELVAQVSYHLPALEAAGDDRQAASAALGRAETLARDAVDGLGRLLAEQAGRPERRRMAREVHDLVGHGLSLVAVCSAVSARRLQRGEGTVREAVDEVRAVTATTQRELLALVERLDGPGGRADPVAADAELTVVRALVETARRHGHAVELTVADGAVPPGAAGVVADVVREGLTNVRKHAGAVPTRVTVGPTGAGGVEVVVANEPGSPASGAGSRSGLDGLTARARELGGEVEAAATPEGGWRLRCVLPSRRPTRRAWSPEQRAPRGARGGSSTPQRPRRAPSR